jgi:hypothetical protein
VISRLIFDVTLRNVCDMDASTIIEAKGGPAVVASAVNAKPGAVRGWKHRNQFPRRVWPDLLAAFPDLSLDDLRAAEAA